MTNTNRDAKRDAVVMEAMGVKTRCIHSDWPEEWQYEKRPGYWAAVVPFITEPTYETDGVVLEWVQGRDLHPEFLEAYKGILISKFDKKNIEDFGETVSVTEDAANWIVMHMHYYKPGMYALALEAVMEERDG